MSKGCLQQFLTKQPKLQYDGLQSKSKAILNAEGTVSLEMGEIG